MAQASGNPSLVCFQPERSKPLVESLVTLLKQPNVNSGTLQAVIRPCLRLTRDHSNACHFAHLGGIGALLNMPRSAHFTGLEAMATLLIRHVYENRAVLVTAMLSNMHRLSSHELHSSLRQLNSASCRDPSLFAETIKSSLRIENEQGKVNLSFYGKVALLKPEDLCQESKDATTELLNSLPFKFEHECQVSQEKIRDDNLKIFTTITTLKLLAELCRFCPPVAQLILEHRYLPGHIASNCSAIEFILDNLALSDSKAPNRPDLVCNLIKFIIRGQAKQVMLRLHSELVAALKRALTRPESSDNQSLIKAIIRMLHLALDYAYRSNSNANWASVVETLKQSDLLNSLAMAIHRLDFSTNQAVIGVNAIIVLLMNLVGVIAKRQKVPEASANTSPSLVVYDLTKQDEQLERICGEITPIDVCPLAHPFLSTPSTDASLKLNQDIWHFESCYEPPNITCREANLAGLSPANVMLIPHGYDQKCNANHFQKVHCSACRWYQECCLVNGPLFMHDTLMLAFDELKYHLYCTNQANYLQWIKTQTDARAEHEKRVSEKQKAKNALDLVKATEATKSSSRNDTNEPGERARRKEQPSQQAYKLTDQQRAILGDAPLPEGLDPAVLVELPDDIRQEVIAQQNYINEKRRQPNQPMVAPNETNISPHVHNQLPPEVRRNGAAQQRASRTTDEVVIFIESLSPEMRRQVLAEMHDSQMRFLPENLVVEVQQLRQGAANRIARNLQIGDGDDDDMDMASPIVPFHNAAQRRVGQARPIFLNHPLLTEKLINDRALTSVLSLLLVSSNNVNLTNFYELVQALSGHSSTRRWITQALLDIVERTKLSEFQDFDNELTGGRCWFVVKATSHAVGIHGIRIYPQACVEVCSNALQLLDNLIFSFPDLLVSTMATLSPATFFDLLADLEDLSTTVSSPHANSEEKQFSLTNVLDLLVHPVVATSCDLTERVVNILFYTLANRKSSLSASAMLTDFEKKLTEGVHIKLLVGMLYNKSSSDSCWQSTFQLLDKICSTFKATCLIVHRLILSGAKKLGVKVLADLNTLCPELANHSITSFYCLASQNKLLQCLSLIRPIHNLLQDKTEELKKIENQHLHFEQIWTKLTECLTLLCKTPVQDNAIEFSPLVEVFFLLNGPSKPPITGPETLAEQLAHINQANNQMVDSGTVAEKSDKTTEANSKLLAFINTNRVALNLMVRHQLELLDKGSFSFLLDYGHVIDFEVKQIYWRYKLARQNRLRGHLFRLFVRRSVVFEDSFRALDSLPVAQWGRPFYVVFNREEGQDAGGLLREWYTIIAREIFNPNYALFITSEDHITYKINPTSYCNSNHLNYFKFIGRWMAKALLDRQNLDCHFTRSLYKHILGKGVRYSDMEKEDKALYKGLVFMLEHNVDDIASDMKFVLEVDEFGATKTIELVPNGRNIAVTEQNKHRYVKLLCQAKMTSLIRSQLNAFLEGFYSLIPKKLIAIFSENELELLISGMPTINVDNMRQYTIYHGFTSTSPQIQWFWQALHSFDQTQRAKFLQFVTGTSKVPLGGFSHEWHLSIRHDNGSSDRLPCAHTCFNELDLPIYSSYEKLCQMLLKAIEEYTEGFGLA